MTNDIINIQTKTDQEMLFNTNDSSLNLILLVLEALIKASLSVQRVKKSCFEWERKYSISSLLQTLLITDSLISLKHSISMPTGLSDIAQPTYSTEWVKLI